MLPKTASRVPLPSYSALTSATSRPCAQNAASAATRPFLALGHTLWSSTCCCRVGRTVAAGTVWCSESSHSGGSSHAARRRNYRIAADGGTVAEDVLAPTVVTRLVVASTRTRLLPASWTRYLACSGRHLEICLGDVCANTANRLRIPSDCGFIC